MRPGFRSAADLQECRRIGCALALSSVMAAGSGVLFAAIVGEPYISLMRMAVSRHVSIVGLAVSVWIPFLASLFLIVHSKPLLVYIICGARLFLFSAASWAISRSFFSAGWLIRLLLQLPDLCLIPILLWFSFRKLMGGTDKRTVIRCIVFAAVIGMFYYWSIPPFLADLIESYEAVGR